MAVVPSVVARPKPPAPVSGSTEGKPDKKGAKGQVVPEPEPEPELNQDGGKMSFFFQFRSFSCPLDFA